MKDFFLVPTIFEEPQRTNNCFFEVFFQKRREDLTHPGLGKKSKILSAQWPVLVQRERLADTIAAHQPRSAAGRAQWQMERGKGPGLDPGDRSSSGSVKGKRRCGGHGREGGSGAGSWLVLFIPALKTSKPGRLASWRAVG